MKTFVLTQAIVSPPTYKRYVTFILILQSLCNKLFKARKYRNNYFTLLTTAESSKL